MDDGSRRSIDSTSTPSIPASPARARALSRATTTTDAPASWRARTVSTPIPAWPPVTMATWPLRSMPSATSAAVEEAPNPEPSGRWGATISPVYLRRSAVPVEATSGWTNISRCAYDRGDGRNLPHRRPPALDEPGGARRGARRATRSDRRARAHLRDRDRGSLGRDHLRRADPALVPPDKRRPPPRRSLPARGPCRR